jgi:hypothetical protein
VGAPTRCLQVDGCASLCAGRLAHLVACKTALPAASFVLLVHGHIAEAADVVAQCGEESAFVELRVCGALRGGKGGFGANLRGANASKKTTNFGACRDLSGRRLRDLEREREAAAPPGGVAGPPRSPPVASEGECGEAREPQREGEAGGDVVDIGALNETIDVCSHVVEDAVAEGLRAARALRSRRAKGKNKRGQKRSHTATLSRPGSEAVQLDADGAAARADGRDSAREEDIHAATVPPVRLVEP